jgi:hypothetical protein
MCGNLSKVSSYGSIRLAGYWRCGGGRFQMISVVETEIKVGKKKENKIFGLGLAIAGTLPSGG